MNKIKRSLALLLVLAMVLLTACGGNSNTDSPAESAGSKEATVSESNSNSADEPTTVVIPEGALVGSGQAGGTGYMGESIQADVVKVSSPDIPTNISPWAGTSTGRHVVNNSMYQPLFEFDKVTGEYVLVIAESIEPVDDLTYRVTIHDHIYDSAGNPFTVDDAIFSIDNCQTLGNVSGMNYIGSTEKVSDYAFDITMTTTADYQFASSVSMIYMVTQKAYEDSGDEMASQPVATGAYKMKAFESGSSITLEATEDYWGAELNDRDSNTAWYYHAQNVDTIEFIKISEASQASVALETGTVDVALVMTANEAGRLDDNDAFNVWRTTDSRSFNLFFNCGDMSPMANQQLRQAICYAIDNEKVLQATGGYGLLSTTFGAAIFKDCNPEWANADYYTYDVEKAKELIAESGFDTSQPIRFMIASNSDEKVTIGQIIQSYLIAVGLDVQLDQYDGASFASSKYDETMYDIRLDDASFSCLADLWNQFLSAGNSDKSYAQIFDPEMESLLATLQTAEGRTAENVDATHNYIKDRAYCYGLYCRELFDTTSSNIAEFVYMPKLYAMPGAFTYN